MGEKIVSYSAVILDEESHQNLVNRFSIPFHWTEIAHHLTISFSTLKGTILENRIGEKIEFSGLFFGANLKCCAIKIDTDLRLIAGTPHITIAIDTLKGGKPKDSNFLNFDKKLSTPITLSGTIQEIYK